MNRIIRLVNLELKTAMRCAIKACMFLLILTGLFLGLLVWYLHAVDADNSKALIKIGVVNEETAGGFGTYVAFANKLSSLKDFCRLESMNKEEAFQGLSEGKLQMVMVIPKNFLDDAVHMRDASFVVYLPTDKMSQGDRKLIDLMLAVEDVMLTTEGSIIAMYKGMEYYSFPVTISEMENGLTNLYVSELLNRDNYFDVKYSSGFGEYSIVEYYMGAAVIMCLMLAGVFYLSMYNGQIMFVERMFAKTWGDRILFALLKTLCISLCLCIPAWIMLYAADAICEAKGSTLIYAKGITYFMIFIICVSIAAFVNMLGVLLSGSVDKVVTYIMITVFLGVISGVVGTKYYLPDFLRKLADYWPASCYHRGFMASMWDSPECENYLMVSLYALAMMIVGTVFFIKSDWKKKSHE